VYTFTDLLQSDVHDRVVDENDHHAMQFVRKNVAIESVPSKRARNKLPPPVDVHGMKGVCV
jgi:hypothetical protein